MAKKKFPLTTRLIDGFLYLYLEDWQTEAAIAEALLEKYGDDVCRPAETTQDGTPKYRSKLRKSLAMGVKNNVYQHDPTNDTYKVK